MHGGSRLRHLPLIFGLNIRCSRTRLRRRARLVNLRFQISRFLNQDGSKLRVGGCLGELEKRRRLTHEIIPAYHAGSPSTTQRKNTAVGSLVPSRCAKVNTWNFARVVPASIRKIGPQGNMHCGMPQDSRPGTHGPVSVMGACSRGRAGHELVGTVTRLAWNIGLVPGAPH